MSTLGIGPLTLHTNQIGWRETKASSFSRGEVEGEGYPATVTGPGGLELDLEVFMSLDGQGMVHCPDSSTVPAEYARLAHGARLGVYMEVDGSWIVKQLRLLRFSGSQGWGNPTMTTVDELDGLLTGSFVALMRSLGAVSIGPKSTVLGIKGNDIAIRWSPESGPQLPLSAYVLTRVLPIYQALS